MLSCASDDSFWLSSIWLRNYVVSFGNHVDFSNFAISNNAPSILYYESFTHWPSHFTVFHYYSPHSVDILHKLVNVWCWYHSVGWQFVVILMGVHGFYLLISLISHIFNWKFRLLGFHTKWHRFSNSFKDCQIVDRIISGKLIGEISLNSSFRLNFSNYQDTSPN